MTQQINIRAYMAELVGTFALVLVCAAAVCTDKLAVMSPPSQTANGVVVAQPTLGLIGISLACGLVLAAALAAVLPFSDGYLNPAVTITLWACKRLDGGKTIGLLFVQLLGAAMAGGVVRFIFPQIVLEQARLGTPHLGQQFIDFTGASNLNWLRAKGAAVEIALTFVVTFVIYATLIDPRAPKVLGTLGRWLSGLWVGLALFAVTLIGFSLTGAAVNPARWFGTVIWENGVPALQTMGPYTDGMVYWFGPTVGALLAGIVYTYMILPEELEHPAATTASTGKLAVGSTLSRAKK